MISANKQQLKAVGFKQHVLFVGFHVWLRPSFVHLSFSNVPRQQQATTAAQKTGSSSISSFIVFNPHNIYSNANGFLV